MKPFVTITDVILLLVEFYQYSRLTLEYRRLYENSQNEEYFEKMKKARRETFRILKELHCSKFAVEQLFSCVNRSFFSLSTIVLDDGIYGCESAFFDYSAREALLKNEEFLSNLRSMVEIPENWNDTPYWFIMNPTTQQI